MPVLSDEELGISASASVIGSRVLSDEEIGLGPQVPGHEEFARRSDAQAEPEPGIAEKVGRAIKSANEDPVGSFTQSIAKILTATGVMSKTDANRIARDMRAGIEAMGPLGAEFLPLAAAPATRKLPSASTGREALQGRIDVAGAQATTAAEPQFAGNINLKRIYAPEDVKQVISETAAANEEFMAARRGVISHDETRDMARLVGMSPEKLAKRVQGEAFNAEEMFAARELLVQQATKVKDLAQKAKGGSDLDKLNFAEEMTRLAAIQEQVSGATAEAGRTLQQFRMLAGATKDDIARLLEAQRAGGLDDVIELASVLDDPAQVANFVANASKAKTSDMLLEAWINGLLSGPATHATNVLSNSLVALWAIPESAVAAAISKVTGSGIRGREVLGRLYGLVEGAKDGLRAAWRTFKTEEPSDLASKIEQRRYRSIPSAKVGGVQIGGKQVRIPSRLLMGEDEFFKAIGARQEINALAFRQALNEGLRGRPLAQRVQELKANPTDVMKKAARETAEKQTFTNPLGPVGRNILAIARQVPAFRVIAPFVRTPINILKFAAERSPFAPLFKEVRQNLKGANGAVARDQQIARIGVGSAASGAIAYEAMQGNITGGGPADPRRRAVLYASGWQPYSIKVGDNYYSYGRLEPMGMLFGVASDFVELSHLMSEEEQDNLAALVIGSVSKNLVSKTWLRGVSEVIEAFNDPDRYGASYVQNLAGTLIPTGVAQWARTQDPHLREARSVLDKIKDRIPGQRETLPTKRDLFGEPIKLEGAAGPDIVSPIYTSAAKNDPVINELIRLKIAPSKPTRQIRGVDLTPEEYERLQEVTGGTARKALTNLVNDPQWPKLNDDAKTELIEAAFRKARDFGRASVLTQFPDIVPRIVQSRAQ